MQRPVYISHYFVLAPGIDNTEAFSKLVLYGSNDLDFNKIEFDSSSPFYPQRSDLKAMREDVVASVIAVSELLKSANITAEACENIGLFTSTGVFFGEISNTINTLKSRLLEENESGRIRENKSEYFDAIPPLTALRTLTNAIESYASLYSKLAGENAAFGGTSAGGFYALQEAHQAIAHGRTQMAVVGSGNIGEPILQYAYRNFNEDGEGWKSTSCAAFLMLESAESLAQRNLQPLAKIKQLKQSSRVPRLFINQGIGFDELYKDSHPEFCVFPGGMNDADYFHEKYFLQGRDMEVFSLFPLLGNTNSASVFMSVAASLALQKQKGFSKSICLERDVYEREFLVELDYDQMI